MKLPWRSPDQQKYMDHVRDLMNRSDFGLMVAFHIYENGNGIRENEYVMALKDVMKQRGMEG